MASSGKIVGSLLRFFVLLAVVSEFHSRVDIASAFLTTSASVSSCAFFCNQHDRKIVCRGQEQQIRKGQELFSTPPPLSPLSNNEDYDYDDYTTEEVTNMHNVIVSLSEESNDDVRRARLQQIMEIALAGPNGGPKRFSVLFERVLTQVGEKVQKEAREKYAKQAADLEEENKDGESPSEPASATDETESAENPEVKKPREKTAEELQLWALVDMMIQSKTIIKKHKF
mmetsp:Transcript_9489/g.23050  ORF Transcript_9489/g.23050 Transcript_9489/m.23050 type:complete len:228 (+) Transcript_9489:132-815(+)